jgi:hypothetical protein
MPREASWIHVRWLLSLVDAGTIIEKRLIHLFLYRSNCVSNEAQVLMALTQLVNLFLVNGFAWDGSTALRRPSNSILSASGSEYCLTLVSPATIWGGHALSREKAVVCNNFL